MQNAVNLLFMAFFFSLDE